MFYSVKYKLSSQFFWRTLDRIKGDGVITEARSRFFILEDDSRVEIPCDALFHFDRSRFESIVKNAENEAGQKIPLKG